MTPKIIESLSQPGSRNNEDLCGGVGGCVWVMDGATGLWPTQRLAGASDAAWLVAELDAALGSLDSANADWAPLLASAAARAHEKAAAICDLAGCAPFELPSASFVAVRAQGEEVEFANLGDCILLWRGLGGRAQRFGSCGVTRLDADLAAAFATGLAQGLPLDDLRQAQTAMARRHRTLMNTPEGYWILDLSGIGTPHVQTARVRGPAQVMLMSDGFYRLVDVFGRYDDDSLMEAARTRGLAPLYDELRAMEDADPDGVNRPRGKPRDDATAVVIDFS